MSDKRTTGAAAARSTEDLLNSYRVVLSDLLGSPSATIDRLMAKAATPASPVLPPPVLLLPPRAGTCMTCQKELTRDGYCPTCRRENAYRADDAPDAPKDVCATCGHTRELHPLNGGCACSGGCASVCKRFEFAPFSSGKWVGAAEDLARFFHETYERLAPSFSYETRKESAKPWESVPEKNKKLMVEVSRAVLARYAAIREAHAKAEIDGPGGFIERMIDLLMRAREEDREKLMACARVGNHAGVWAVIEQMISFVKAGS